MKNGIFKNGFSLIFTKVEGKYDLQILSEDQSLIARGNPVKIKIYDGVDELVLNSSYSTLHKSNNKIFAEVNLIVDEAIIHVRDTWTPGKNTPILKRKVTVEGNSDKVFMSAVEFKFIGHTREETEYFIPGMVYGDTSNLTGNAMGGEDLYLKENGALWIREDRMPAPLMAFRFSDNISFSILDLEPDGSTTLEDAQNVSAISISDEYIKLGSLFAEHQADTLKAGFAYPAWEGEYTYSGDSYPGGQLQQWRKLYHPLKDGFIQKYKLSFSMNRSEDFQSYYSAEWQSAFRALNPMVSHQDIELVRKTMLSIIPDLLVRSDGKTGLPNMYPISALPNSGYDGKAVFGFTGKNIEMAYYFLYEEPTRKLAYEIISSFTDIKVNPPAGEGYYFENNNPALAIPSHNQIYLRSFGDTMKVLARAYQLEKRRGYDNAEWLRWMSDFGEWILGEQYEGGGFPRGWEPVTGEVSADSPASSYNIIPFLCEMYVITGEDRWLNAAVKTGDFSWNSGHKKGRFVGGTIDNPDVLDKEAGTLSTEAYIKLYEVTSDKKWLTRAERAAQYAETWIYIWNVPMVPGDGLSEWTHGVSTVGIQLISTGHSLVDNYMAYDVDEYAKLYRYTGKRHYFDVAKILLHNTKNMLALPGRHYHYRGPGWIQEHWSLAPPRGKSLHAMWLPWVTTSNLHGIFETEIFDKKIFDELKR